MYKVGSSPRVDHRGDVKSDDRADSASACVSWRWGRQGWSREGRQDLKERRARDGPGIQSISIERKTCAGHVPLRYRGQNVNTCAAHPVYVTFDAHRGNLARGNMSLCPSTSERGKSTSRAISPVDNSVKSPKPIPARTTGRYESLHNAGSSLTRIHAGAATTRTLKSVYEHVWGYIRGT